jgi:hypothetical protein
MDITPIIKYPWYIPTSKEQLFSIQDVCNDTNFYFHIFGIVCNKLYF